MVTDFQALYEKYARDVFRFSLYLSGNRAEAEDIASETFVRAWNSPARIRQATVKAYLFTIARNCYLQGLRGRSRQAELNVEIVDPGRGPQVIAEQREDLAGVLRALQQLPEVDRSALLMCALDEMSYAEISSALGLSLGAVKTKIHRARLRLAESRGT
jgi:RNA polymerase sigma-70 factor (ECF subfamily)